MNIIEVILANTDLFRFKIKKVIRLKWLQPLGILIVCKLFK